VTMFPQNSGGGVLDISNPCILKTVGHIETNMEVLGRLRPHFFFFPPTKSKTCEFYHALSFSRLMSEHLVCGGWGRG